MRSLVWKELRQGRPLLLFSAIAALGLAAAHTVAAALVAHQPHRGGLGAGLEAAASFLLVVLPPLFALLAGAGLFAAEIDHGTLPVLFALPHSRVRIWALKAASGLALAGLACALLFVLSHWLMLPVYRALPLRPWPDLTLVALAVFALAVFTTVLTPHVVGAVIAALALGLALAIGWFLFGAAGALLLGYDRDLEIELWAALSVPALLFVSARAVKRGELLQWNRTVLLQIPVLLVGLLLTAALACGAARMLTGYSRASVRDIIAGPATPTGTVAAVLVYGRPVAYQRGRTVVALAPGEAPARQSGSSFEPRPLDWGDLAAGKLEGGPLYRNTSTVFLEVKSGRELGVVRQPLYTYQAPMAVAPDGSVAAVAAAPNGLSWGDRPWDHGARLLTIVDLKSGKRLYSGEPVPADTRGGASLRDLTWSAHGKYLALNTWEGPYLMSRDGSSLRKLTVGLGTGLAEWSPTEEILYAIGGGGLSRLHPETGRIDAVWRPADALAEGPLFLLPSGLSPDGRFLALASDDVAAWGAGPAGFSKLTVVSTDGALARTIWRSTTPTWLSVAWSRDSRTFYLLASSPEEKKLTKPPTSRLARVLRWQVGEVACTALAAALPYADAHIVALGDGRVLLYPSRRLEQRQYTLRNEPVAARAGPIIIDAAGRVRPFPDAASSVRFANDNDFLTVDQSGRLITVQGPPGKEVVRAYELGTGARVRVYP